MELSRKQKLCWPLVARLPKDNLSAYPPPLLLAPPPPFLPPKDRTKPVPVVVDNIYTYIRTYIHMSGYHGG